MGKEGQKDSHVVFFFGCLFFWGGGVAIIHPATAFSTVEATPALQAMSAHPGVNASNFYANLRSFFRDHEVYSHISPHCLDRCVP